MSNRLHFKEKLIGIPVVITILISIIIIFTYKGTDLNKPLFDYNAKKYSINELVNAFLNQEIDMDELTGILAESNRSSDDKSFSSEVTEEQILLMNEIIKNLRNYPFNFELTDYYINFGFRNMPGWFITFQITKGENGIELIQEDENGQKLTFQWNHLFSMLKEGWKHNKKVNIPAGQMMVIINEIPKNAKAITFNISHSEILINSQIQRTISGIVGQDFDKIDPRTRFEMKQYVVIKHGVMSFEYSILAHVYEEGKEHPEYSRLKRAFAPVTETENPYTGLWNAGSKPQPELEDEDNSRG
jgi:hypothetical protein